MDIPAALREAFALLGTADALRRADRLADAAGVVERAVGRLAEATHGAEALAGDLRAEVARRAEASNPPAG